MEKLNIFVSSTCYDLSQVRTDLFEKITSFGHNPILSEFATFPINPSNNTVENCISVINSQVDVFILIIGCRYGYQIDGNNSITNLEYLTAVNKKIPIYVFIHKKIISILPVYLKNKEGDYSDVVDNPKVFDFAHHVRSTSGLWAYEFENFQDIFGTLKIQLSYLFKEALGLRNQMYANPDQEFHRKLSPVALKLIYYKSAAWEYEFLTQTLIDEIKKFEGLKNDYEYKIVLKHRRRIKNDDEFIEWSQDQFSAIIFYIQNINSLIGVIIPKYINEPGQPSDLKGLYYSANTYARTYESLINWTIDIRSVAVTENQEELRDILADMTASALKSIWEFPFNFHKVVIEKNKTFTQGMTVTTESVNLVLSIGEDVLQRFRKAMARYKTHIERTNS